MNLNEDLARKWLKRAESSLAKSKIGTQYADIMLEDLCFDAQQATEKALKSILALHNLPIPKTHSIGFLINSLEDNGLLVPLEIKESVALTEYAVETRYPGDFEPVEFVEYEQAVFLSEAVLNFVRTLIQPKGLFDAE